MGRKVSIDNLTVRPGEVVNISGSGVTRSAGGRTRVQVGKITGGGQVNITSGPLHQVNHFENGKLKSSKQPKGKKKGGFLDWLLGR